MSAYVVDKVHIDLLITAALKCGRSPFTFSNGAGPSERLDFTNADEVGAMLWQANVDSVNYRYDEPETVEEDYKFSELRGPIDPVTVIKAIECYDYQSCETPMWRDSMANAFCEALTSRMHGLLPGYDDAPWGVGDSNVLLKVGTKETDERERYRSALERLHAMASGTRKTLRCEDVKAHVKRALRGE